MNEISRDVLIILLLILANGVFALAEVAVVASRKTRLQQRANEGDLKAKAALALVDSPNRFLSTVQIGITLIGVMAGALGGATIAEEIAVFLDAFPALSPHAESIGLGLVVLVITYLSLIIGELVPKRIALHSPNVSPRWWHTRCGGCPLWPAPLVWILSFSTDTVLRLIGLRVSEEPPVTEAEITLMIEQGTQAGSSPLPSVPWSNGCSAWATAPWVRS
jgi:putative hemolysin